MNHANEAKSRRSRRVAIAAGVALLVALAGVVVTALCGGRAYPPPRPAPAPPAISDEAVPNVSRQTAPWSASSGGGLGNVEWTDVHGIALPVSARFGPADTLGGRAAQFSHDWFGALLAAVHISARAAASAGPSVFRSTIGEQVVGADADELLANVEANYRQRRTNTGLLPGVRLLNTSSALAGYRFDAVSDSMVSLRLAISIRIPSEPGTVYLAIRLDVRWLLGDWRLVAPPDGLWSRRSTVTALSSGYTPFPTR
jgi:hypothetical protein